MSITLQSFIVDLADVLEKKTNEVAPTDHFRDYEEWDSIALLSVMAMLEDNYSVIIEREQFEKLETVEDLFSAVNGNQK